MIFIYFGSCSSGNEPADEKIIFGIYLLEDETLKLKDVINKDLSQMKTQQLPIISNKDIDYYDFSSHTIYLKQDKGAYLPEYKIMAGILKWIDRPFLVLANGYLRYIGFFHGWFSNTIDIYPNVNCGLLQTMPINILYIQRWAFYVNKDFRKDVLVKDALKEANILRETIEVTLDSLTIYKTDTVSVEYTIIIKNIDKVSWYILDYDKAGAEIYNYYEGGVHFLIKDYTDGYYAKYKKSLKPSSIDNYFTKLEPGQTIKRTIFLKGFENIPYRTYYCNLEYTGPEFSTSNGQKAFIDGNTLPGAFESNLMEIEYTADKNCIIKNKNVILP
jgi:hypothetical protein